MYPLPPPNRSQPSGPSESQSRDQSQLAKPPSTSNVTIPSHDETSAPKEGPGKKRKKHRGGKRRKPRRQSFAAAPSEVGSVDPSIDESRQHEPLVEDDEVHPTPRPLYRANPTNRSHESLDSEALLDHRGQPAMRPRRDSRLNPNHMFATSYRSGTFPRIDTPSARRRLRSRQSLPDSEASDHDETSDRTPLLKSDAPHRSPGEGYGLFRVKSHTSTVSSSSRKQRKRSNGPGSSLPKSDHVDINNPPSVPPSPTFGAHYGDVMVGDDNFLPRSPDSRRNLQSIVRDTLIDIDGDDDRDPNSAPPSPRLRPEGLQRHHTVALPVEGDVCFPGDEASEANDDYFDRSRTNEEYPNHPRRRRRREWPQLWVLDEFSRAEKEERAAGERRALKISEPVFVDGRLRAPKTTWHRQQEDLEYRYTYFNEEFESTIHSQTISELVQPGTSFRELFIPDPPEIIESSSSSEDEEQLQVKQDLELSSPVASPKSQLEREPSATLSTLAEGLIKSKSDPSGKTSERESGAHTPQKKTTPLVHSPKPKKYGPRPTFWLDVVSPTDQEMRVLAKAFGIHALTSEDIMMQEAREKVELFRNYYFINYRTFEQDPQSEDYLEPINMYVCVFRHGILTFHFSQIPHPANVRRRIRQLSDYLILSADWISYAIIDDITDVYQPLITSIEEQVDDIDDLILKAFQSTNELAGENRDKKERVSEKDSIKSEEAMSGIDVLIRIGECRKKVMSLYRLLGNKADVIKGFAKRCNEQWEVAPKSEIGLYLGDIQDHILTMTGNLSHYETLLSRAHGNYLAQTADVLGKLTVLGTIVLPMNIITGMFGGNFKVPGQDIDNLNWFWGTTAALILFGIACFYWCKKVYKVV
ncbi:hypothetical protein B0A52_06776 [Exophiala mesophila]|uniref:Uncharacterized protein n=1 Tax=Exophiala mesophila TaxID=212818 RepID=A0A438N096_EXOME|nr:hypothetical protein B0A52_06776 [Exophiala mesophila]